MSALPATNETVTGLNSERFATHMGQRAALPDWWLEAKKEAWNQYNALPLPTRSDERWRFSNLKGLDLEGFELPEEASLHVPHLPDFAHAGEITFSNRQVVGRVTLAPELIKQGVIFAPLNEALRDHGDLVRQYFQKHPANLGSEKFVALNTAFTATGAVLYVPTGVEITAPLVVQHTLSGDHKAAFPHTLVILEKNAKATLVEYFVSAQSDAVHLVSGVNDLHAGPGSQLTYVGVQNWSRRTLAFQTNSIVAERDARVLSLSIHLGGNQSRHESHSRLLGPGAHSEMLALTIADGEHEYDQRTMQTHAAPHTSSNLLYKNALLDQAKTIFSGIIVVEPDAQKTDAYQSNRNLMLSDTAAADSLPGLEIEANDVRCTHGATTSRIDADQLYYLLSRGIPRAQASELLVFGFFEEVLNKLEDMELHAALSQLIQKKFKS
ncbi:MAG: Fe-S cluster assembly protein SufD [Cephaloticoccus sp.]|nr:Fe-S cluster assembly protein SufD [Cephaloticoccus sp.]MCF7759930.1 Fe-S cluster assembly protein SufD [Cephaloticoccus sp.]